MTQFKPCLLFSPGPTQVSQTTLDCFGTHPIHHRTIEFEQLFQETQGLLQYYFQTKEHVFSLTASGTGAMEACLVNLLNPGDQVLCYDGGKFGERWAEMAEKIGCEVTIIKAEWGESFALSNFANQLEEKNYSAFLIQSCETSSATMQPIKEISELLKKHQPDCLLLVDGITAVGSYPLPMDELNIDALITGSQKSMSLLTGMSFLSFSKKAWERSLNSKTFKYYFDLQKEKEMNLKNATHFSTPTTFFLALNQKLKHIEKIGLDNFFEKTKLLQMITTDFLKSFGCCLLSESPSISLTAFYLPPNIKADQLQKIVLGKGLYLAGGQEHLKAKILRWGHMGDISREQQIKAFRIFTEAFCELEKNVDLQKNYLEALDEAEMRTRSFVIIDQCIN